MPEEIVNPVSGVVKELGELEFLALFDVSVRDRILQAARLPGTEAIVCMENLQMDSSDFGRRSALAVGDGRTYKFDDVRGAGFRLGDVPSRFQYPMALWRVPQLKS